MLEMTDEKTISAKLKEELFIKKENGILKLDDVTIKEADEFCENYKEFLNKSKTEREFVKNALKMAKEKGFEEFDYNKKYTAGDKVYYIKC